MGLLNALFKRREERIVPEITIPRGLEDAIRSMNHELHSEDPDSDYNFIRATEFFATQARDLGMTFEEIKPVTDRYFDALLIKERKYHEKYEGDTAVFFISSSPIAEALIGFTEILGYPTAEVFRRNSRIVRARFDDLRKSRRIGFDIHNTQETFERIYDVVRNSGRVVSGFEDIRDNCMESVPLDKRNVYRRGDMTAIRVRKPEESPKDGGETSEGFFVTPYKQAWVLFEGKHMPLRVNERSSERTIVDYNSLQRYRAFFEAENQVKGGSK